MSKKRLGSVIAIAVASIALVALGSGIGQATNPVDATSELIAQGQVHSSTELHPHADLDVVVAKNTFAPGGSSGWHSHPGGVVVVVQSGELTLYRELVGGGECHVRTYHAGDVFFERAKYMQNGVNTGSATTVTGVTFFDVPHGGSARIERADPGDCPS